MPPIWASEKIATKARNSATSRSKRSALIMRCVYSSARCRSHGSPVPLVARHVTLKSVRTYASRISSEMSSGPYVSVQLSEVLVGRVRFPLSASALSPSEPLQASTTRVQTMPANAPAQRTEQTKAQSSLRWSGLMKVGSRSSEPGGDSISKPTFTAWYGASGPPRTGPPRMWWSAGSTSSTVLYLPRRAGAASFVLAKWCGDTPRLRNRRPVRRAEGADDKVHRRRGLTGLGTSAYELDG
eukprot:scaffold96342_cov73-Phaeocystis_antarctica.AAC.1